MSHLRRFAAALATSLLLVGGVACSSDDSSSDPAPADQTDGGSANRNVDDLLDAVAGDDADGIRDAVRGATEGVDLDGLGNALALALKADRYEVDGDTLHIYLGSDATTSGEIACVSATMIVEDRGNVVIHDGSQEFPC